jgi:hypothetical protein
MERFRDSPTPHSCSAPFCFLWATTLVMSGTIGKETSMTDFSNVQKHLTAKTTAQTDFAKSAHEIFVSAATKIAELYKTFAQEAFKPFTSSFLPK